MLVLSGKPLISLICLSSLVVHITCHPILVVISLDGFRNDYINETLTPNLYRLANDGVKGHMQSSFITKTYPNHQSIATGYYEETHGIVNNKMFDPQYNGSDQTFNVDHSPDKWWTDSPVIPIWTANQMMDRQNRFSGSMYWPGSHVQYKNQKVRYLMKYDEENPKGLDWNKRMDMIIDWMTTSPEEANCVFVYFEEPDEESHKFGPFSEQVFTQVRRLDQTMGYFLDRLKQTNLYSRTNLVIVSDHGMAEINEDRVIDLSTFLNQSWYDFHGVSPTLSLQPKPGYKDRVYQTLLNASKTMNFTVYKREDIPEVGHYKKHRRVLDIFVIADDGYDIYRHFKRSWLRNRTNPVWGNHGYNNTLPSMRPLFIASGPAFKTNYNHPKTFQNVDLYPLMLNVLQLYPVKQFPSNGSFANVFEILIPPIASEDYDTSAQKWFNLILYIFGGIGILFFGSVCLICGTNVGKSLRKQKPPDIVWDSLGSGLDIDLRSHLDPDVHDFSRTFDDDVITRAKRLQRPEETLLLLEDDDEEDL